MAAWNEKTVRLDRLGHVASSTLSILRTTTLAHAGDCSEKMLLTDTLLLRLYAKAAWLLGPLVELGLLAWVLLHAKLHQQVLVLAVHLLRA